MTAVWSYATYHLNNSTGDSRQYEKLTIASLRLRELSDFVATGFTDYQIIPGKIRTIQYTYEALFGPVAWRNTDPRHPGDFQRLLTVQQQINVLKRMASGNLRMQIWCDDSLFLTDEFPPEFEDVPRPPNSLWDSRPAHQGGQAAVSFRLPGKCSDNPNLEVRGVATTVSETKERVGVIIMCPGSLPPRRAPHNDWRIRPVYELRHSTIPIGTPLDEIVAVNPLAVFLRGLMHVEMGGNRNMGVYRVPVENGWPPRGWQVATLLPLVDRNKALENAALALDNYGWSTGLANPLFPDEMGSTHFLASVNEGYDELTRNNRDPENPPPIQWDD
ncbi:hypothetical protein AJ79_02745 [Helicocarpus griseus UAMH5409]|uniref:Uncharacterized protein n=1 Tax=Helicocarpus griseus UAMH5409 TaxID=1447875 RepID=A0A2B7Y1H1_9EURO|nr:hypothetical protein AJ79_02745 [Helicocarpus griseus UAMH5409]